MTKRKYFTKPHKTIPLPDLLEAQKKSYEWFLEKGFNELFEEISPIKDHTGNLELYFLDYYLDEPKYDEFTAKSRNSSYEASIRAAVRLVNKKTKEKKEQEVYLGEFPLMTKRGSFIVNGVERVVVSQLIRSPGVFFTQEESKGRKWYGAKIIPNRGAWLELETDTEGVISVKIDRQRKIPVTALLRAFGYGNDEELKELFKDVDTNPDLKYIEKTIQKDPSSSTPEGLREVYKRIRPGDLATIDNAKQMIHDMFFRFDRYDFGKVGRYRLNKRFNEDLPLKAEKRVLRKKDLVNVVKEIIRLSNTQEEADDIDHLGNRRVRCVGELIQGKMRTGLMRMERIVKNKMSTLSQEELTPAQLVNARPVIGVIKEFFMNSQLSQFMDQINSLAELEHKRRLSAMGPGGLTRERAGFEVRDVHRSHYGRICPIQTPEGPNIGLVEHMASYARINDLGFIETPYRKVLKEIDVKRALNKRCLVDIREPKTNKILVKKDEVFTKGIIKLLQRAGIEKVKIEPEVTNEIVYLDAGEEDRAVIAHANVPLDEKGHFIQEKVEARAWGQSGVVSVDQVDYIDVSPGQCLSVATSLIPFLEHDDPNRALMGSNMQRQAVACIKPNSPIVATGIESRVARDSGQMVICEADGEIAEVSAHHITVREKKGTLRRYTLVNFARSNAQTCINQRPSVSVGQRVKKGDILADSSSTDRGELALGQNLLVAFMSWRGGNFEDAILISERVVREDRYTSIHIEDFSVDVRDTKLGPETITPDIPNVSEEKLRNLDENGIIRVGAEVISGDILVGKITPKGETELTAEERLLRAIFGKKARDVKDTSLYLQHGKYGKVVDIKIFSRDRGDKLPAGVIKTIQVTVATLRRLSVGDKLAGRHGNKGVISKIVPEEDMPRLADGRPVDIILDPLGVASRMNIGQILETHLGYAANTLGYKVACPPFEGPNEAMIKEELKKAGLPEDGKIELYDGRTGEKFSQKVTVGYIYMMKLNHLVEDKIHMRATGPYSLVTQQPLGGKAQFGGQRFGEMEVWALEAYGAAYSLQEMLTIKSDDVVGRSRSYEAIVKGEEIKPPSIPASFNVLVKELQSLCLDVELIKEDKK